MVHDQSQACCSNCLRKNYSSSEYCSSKCLRCDKKHHTTLNHEKADLVLPDAEKSFKFHTQDETAQASPKSILIVTTGKVLVLLPTAVILVSLASKLVKARLLIDTFLLENLVSESFVATHRPLCKTNSSILIGIAPDECNSNYAVHLYLKSRYNDFEL